MLSELTDLKKLPLSLHRKLNIRPKLHKQLNNIQATLLNSYKRKSILHVIGWIRGLLQIYLHAMG